MTVDYNNFAKTFSESRKNMKWEEIKYFLSFLSSKKNKNILDIWCWNGRFLWVLKINNIDFNNYLWIDLSKWLLEEAKRFYPENNFLELNMLDLDKNIFVFDEKNPEKKWENIFLIASFHHLDNLENREKVMKNLFNILKKGWKIFMTNWALNSELNNKKYEKSIIKNSENKFLSLDYKIKIWKFERFYHCFDLSELEFLAKKYWFKIIENRLFENKRNFVTILEK